MQFKGERCQADLRQAVVHHIQRGFLGGHKQHPLAACQGIGNDVGDGLRFAGARRPVQDKAAPLLGSINRLQL